MHALILRDNSRRFPLSKEGLDSYASD
jgi:hypothetical protein